MSHQPSTVLVTGGAGYIGSHTVVEMLNLGMDVVVVDNLVNASPESLHRVETITGKPVPFYKVDLLDREGLTSVFSKHHINSVVHFAGLKAVGESTTIPLQYYHNNITGTLILLEVMKKFNVHKLIFSSSCTVYGDPQALPLVESHPVGACTNPYGKTKYFIEEILRDLAKAESGWNIVILRYFNPIGAHKSGLIGEDPQGIPNNLLPYIAQTAVGRRAKVSVYGNDYNTPDGTGVRDYIHVVDLALGHVAALKKVEQNCGCVVYNLGTGKGSSVLEMIAAFSKAAGKQIPYEIVARRPGDIAAAYADPTLAKKELNWVATRSIEEACEDGWRWQRNNPNGFNKA